MPRGLGTKDFTVGEVLTASTLDTYVGPPPNLVDIDVFPTSIDSSGLGSRTVDATALYGGWKQGSDAQNEYTSWDVLLSTGTWTLELVHRTGPGNGIYTFALSTDASSYTSVGSSPYNASASTIDGYTAGGVNNTFSTITGITIVTTGRYSLRVKMQTKNGSSSGYGARMQHVQLRRTA